MRRLSAEQRGFTLIELMVSLLLGMIVLGALFSLVGASGRAMKRTSDRVDASQRGRAAMESTIQQLRASTCLPGSTEGSYVRPFLDATPTSVTWYANLDDDPQADADGDGDPTYDPKQRRLTYVPATGSTPSKLVEDRWSSRPPVATGTAPTSSRVLLTDLEPVSGSGVFAYGAYASGTDTSPSGYVPGDLNRVVRVDVAFVVRPTSASREPATNTSLRSAAYARVINRTTSTAFPYPTYGCTT